MFGGCKEITFCTGMEDIIADDRMSLLPESEMRNSSFFTKIKALNTYNPD
jgi:hypothetical protein